MRQQEVDQGGHVADVDRAVLVAVGSVQVEAGGVVREQVVDQCRHIADVDIAVTVHVAALERAAGIRLPIISILIVVAYVPPLGVCQVNLLNSHDVTLGVTHVIVSDEGMQSSHVVFGPSGQVGDELTHLGSLHIVDLQ